jgi:ABC-type polysaccharide/polyol phosphate export permease
MRIAADIREIFTYRELIVALAMREVRVRYKHSLLGVGWALALPLSLMLVFTFVFSRVAVVDTGDIPYPIFAYLGLLPWQLHANIITQGARSLSDNRPLVTKVYFAREVLPLSVVLSSLVDFAVASTVLAGLMIWFGITPGVGLVLVPVVLIVQIAFDAGCALLLSAANLLYRDVQYILQVGVTLWMFASSVVYPIPGDGAWRWVVLLNPMTPILDAYRSLIVGGEAYLAPEFGVAAALSFLTLFAAWRWFRHVEGTFGELA